MLDTLMAFLWSHSGTGLDIGLGLMAFRLANALKGSQATQDSLIAKVVATQENHESRITLLEAVRKV